MANEQDKTKVLYDAVSKDYDIGTFNEFSAKLQDPTKRKAFYDGVGKEYDLGTFDEFSSKVSPVKKKDLAQPSTDFSGYSQFSQEKPTATIPFRQGVEVDQPKLKVDRVNVVKRADAGEANPDINELADLNQRLIKGGVLTAGEIETGKVDKGDIEDFTLRTRVLRDLREKSVQNSKQLEVGVNKLKEQGQALIQQYQQAPTPELKSQIEQLDKDYQSTVKAYNREKFKQDHYEKRLVQTSDSIKKLANENLPNTFFEGVWKRIKENPKEFTEYVDLFRKSKDEQIQFAKEAYLKMPTKEQKWYSPSSTGEITGDVLSDMYVALGFSLIGSPVAGAAAVSVKQGAIQAGQDFVRAFNQAKNEGIATGQYDKKGNPILREATDDEAYDIATKSAGVGFGTGAIEGLAGVLTGGAATKVAGKIGGKVLPKATKLIERGADVAQDVVIAGGLQTGRNAFDRYQGLQTELLEGVPQNMLAEGLLSTAINVPGAAKDIKNIKASEKAKQQIFESVVNAKNNPEELKKLNENLEIIKNQGLVTESEYNDIVKKVQQYQETLPTIPEEVKNKKAAADLILERKAEEEKLQVVDEGYKKPIQEKINELNKQLLKVDEAPTTPPPAAEVTLPEVEVTAKALDMLPYGVIKYTGKLGKTKASIRGVTYLTSNRGYASFYESGVEKPTNVALENLAKLGDPPLKPEKVSISTKEEIDYAKSIGEPLTPFVGIFQTKQEVDTQNKLREERYQKELKEYNEKKKQLKKQASDYLSPSFLYGKSMKLDIDFSKDSPKIIFEKLKSKGISTEFKGGDFLDNYESDLKEYAAKNGIDYYDGIIGGVQNSMNQAPDEIILINQDKSILKSELPEAYHKAKADGSNPELVKAVEDLVGKKAEPVAEEVKVEEGKAEPTPEEVTAEEQKKKTTKVSDFLRKNLKTKPIVFKDKDGNEIIVAKQGLDWNDMVDNVANLIDKGYEAALAVKEYLETQGWFKSLSKDQQDAVIEQSVTNFETSIKEAEKGVKEFTKEVKKTIKDLTNKVEALKTKVADAKERIVNIRKQGEEIKKWINDNRKELKNLTDAEYLNLSKKLTNANLQSDIDGIMDYLNKALTNADYNTSLSKSKGLHKKLKDLAKSKTTLSNEREALKRFVATKPSSSWDIDKINEYNKFAEELINSVAPAKNVKGEPQRVEKPITTEEIDAKAEQLKADYDQAVYDKLLKDNEAYFQTQGKGLTPKDLDQIKKDLAELNGTDLEKQKAALERLEQRKEFKEAMKQIVSAQIDKVKNLDRSQFTERQNGIIDSLNDIDLEKSNTRSLIELNNVLNNIETNGDFSNAGRAIEAEAKAQKANKEAKTIIENLKLFKFKTNTFWNLVRTKRSFDAIMQRLTLKSAEAQAKLNVALGDTDLSMNHVKVRKFVDKINQTIDNYIKKNKPNAEDAHTLGVVYRLIQNNGVNDVDKQEQFNKIKTDLKSSIENLSKGTEKEKALGELQQKIYNQLDLDNINSQKELIDNFSKANPKGMQIIDNLIKDYSKIEPLFRENQELYNNTTYSPIEFYLPIQNKTLKRKQPTELETSDDFSRNTMGINTSLSKSSIKRVGLNRSNQYMNTDFFNVVSKKAVDIANQAYTLADRVAIQKTIDSEEFSQTFEEDNASVLRDAYKAKADHIMNIYPVLDEVSKFAQVLNKISSAGAVRAIGGALQSIKQPVVLVNTAIQLAQSGNGDLIAKALKIYSSKDEGFRKLLDLAPISKRESTKAGTAISSEVDTISESEIKKGLIELYKKFNLKQEEIADKVLLFLKKGDTMPAELSWAAYYMESLRKQNKDVNKIDWDEEAKNPNKEAIAYAEAMVSNKQNISDPSNISKVVGSKNAWFQLGRNLLAPLSSFSFNTRNRLNDDFLALAKGGDRKAATKDIIATAAEIYAYYVVSKTLYSLLLKPASEKLLEYFGFDPEKDPREWDEIIADIAKNKAKYGLLADFISTGTTVFGEEAGKRLANSVYKAFNDEEPKVGDYANMTDEQWQDYFKQMRDYERTLPFREKPIPDILSGAGTVGIMTGMGYNAYEALNYVFDDQNRFEQAQKVGENRLEGIKTGELVSSSMRTKELTDNEKMFFILSGIFGATSFVFPMLSEFTSINRMAYGKAKRQAERKYGVFEEGKLPTGFYTNALELIDERANVLESTLSSVEQDKKIKEIDEKLKRVYMSRTGKNEVTKEEFSKFILDLNKQRKERMGRGLNRKNINASF